MDGLEHALEQLRDHDRRPLGSRLHAVNRDTSRALGIVRAESDPREQRLAAARLVVEALAVLAGCGGVASDVRALIGQGGHVHEWHSRYRSCTCGQRPPDDAADAAPTGRPASADYCTTHDTARPCPYFHAYRRPVADVSYDNLGPHGSTHPERYSPGPAGDREAWTDLEYTTDD